ncbi:MAG: peptidase P60 [Pseudomonadales bacterium RIFCSPLOWO2_12_59_9]|uniref:C40 family peptidase n=1 Tax=Pseudomonas sp. TaxID=306 RepID=UPI0008CC6F0A|nr:NlpC/P60 family protein [Pseudomonas sp.]OHC33025.1 MAG: peptidase P60 [Pseudomonadales bacterium RIFCSPLOWO2_12_59_9]
MLNRFAPLVPLAFAALLSACAGHVVQPQIALQPVSLPLAEPTHEQVAELTDEKPYQLPVLADSILDRGFELVGTRYRAGGTSTKTGFDCSGFVGYLFREEAGIKLPRSTREMINLDAPLVARNELVPGDIVFFNNRGRGRVSHAGIYIGDDQFIHSSSSRSGGVRVDSMDDRYWRSSFMEAKRVLAQAPAQTKHNPLHH